MIKPQPSTSAHSHFVNVFFLISILADASLLELAQERPLH